MKYPFKNYLYVLGELVGFKENQPELVEKFIKDRISKSDKEIVRDMFNQY